MNSEDSAHIHQVCRKASAPYLAVVGRTDSHMRQCLAVHAAGFAGMDTTRRSLEVIADRDSSFVALVEEGRTDRGLLVIQRSDTGSRGAAPQTQASAMMETSSTTSSLGEAAVTAAQ
jgi:hypothetical protein